MTNWEDHAIELPITDAISSSPNAAEIAAGVGAPEKIRNGIRVRPSGTDGRWDDGRIAADIRRDLGGVLLPGDIVEVEVDVDVDHHVVTLRGRLLSELERAEVRHVVEAVRGVDSLHNRITV